MKYFSAGVRSETPACGCGFDMNDQGIWVCCDVSAVASAWQSELCHSQW